MRKPFKHSKDEMIVINRAHADMMSRLTAGQRYDVARLAWVDADGNIVRDDRQWLKSDPSLGGRIKLDPMA